MDGAQAFVKNYEMSHTKADDNSLSFLAVQEGGNDSDDESDSDSNDSDVELEAAGDAAVAGEKQVTYDDIRKEVKKLKAEERERKRELKRANAKMRLQEEEEEEEEARQQMRQLEEEKQREREEDLRKRQEINSDDEGQIIVRDRVASKLKAAKPSTRSAFAGSVSQDVMNEADDDVSDALRSANHTLANLLVPAPPQFMMKVRKEHRDKAQTQEDDFTHHEDSMGKFRADFPGRGGSTGGSMKSGPSGSVTGFFKQPRRGMSGSSSTASLGGTGALKNVAVAPEIGVPRQAARSITSLTKRASKFE